MKRSTQLLVMAALVGQPLIWIENSMATLGTLNFSILAVAMVILFIAGIALWSLDGE